MPNTKQPEQNKFIKFKGNKDCPKCQGKGHYRYDDIHWQICELCCTHPEGFIELDKEYWPEMIGKEVCKFGCGTERVKQNKTISEGKPTRLSITQGGLRITILNKWVITLFSRIVTPEEFKNLLKRNE